MAKPPLSGKFHYQSFLQRTDSGLQWKSRRDTNPGGTVVACWNIGRGNSRLLGSLWQACVYVEWIASPSRRNGIERHRPVHTSE